MIPAPKRVREWFELLTLFAPERGLFDLVARCDFTDQRWQEVVFSALGAVEGDAPGGEWNPAVARDPAYTALMSVAFQRLARDLLPEAWPKKRRRFFIHIPKCPVPICPRGWRRAIRRCTSHWGSYLHASRAVVRVAGRRGSAAAVVRYDPGAWAYQFGGSAEIGAVAANRRHVHGAAPADRYRHLADQQRADPDRVGPRARRVRPGFAGVAGTSGAGGRSGGDFRRRADGPPAACATRCGDEPAGDDLPLAGRGAGGGGAGPVGGAGRGGHDDAVLWRLADDALGEIGERTRRNGSVAFLRREDLDIAELDHLHDISVADRALYEAVEKRIVDAVGVAAFLGR